MKKFLSFITVFFLLASLLIVILVAVFDSALFGKLGLFIQNNLWPVIAALVVFLFLFSAGVVTNQTRSDGSLISNGFFQFAVLELFLLACGVIYFRYYIQQPGQIIIKLQPPDMKESVRLALEFSGYDATTADTIHAPVTLNDRTSGLYRFEILDDDIVYFAQDLTLAPATSETLFIPVEADYRSLTVFTDPDSAEIWIDDSLFAYSPDTVNLLNKDTILLEVKLEGYQTYTDTLDLTENVDLDTLALAKLFTLRVLSDYDDIRYRIYNSDKEVVYTGIGSRYIKLPMGPYTLSYDGGEGQIISKNFNLNRYYNLYIP